MKNTLILSISAFFILAYFPTHALGATGVNTQGNPQVLVCDVLGSLGLGCGANDNNKVVSRVLGDSTSNSSSQNPTTQNSNGSSRQSGSVLEASVSNTAVKRNVSNEKVILVKTSAVGEFKPTLGIKSNEAIFEIIKGQRHFVPTISIFLNYGFDLSAVQDMTREELRKFPRTKLVNVKDVKNKVYYITEGNMIRLVPGNEAFKSYGDREEDVITISKEELNFYPRHQYIFLDAFGQNQERDVFQIVEGESKRYIVPQILKRLKITSDQVAPVNRTEFELYKYGPPILF